MNQSERLNLATMLDIQLDLDCYIKVPKHCNRIKLDVGLSMTAPHAIAWLASDPNLFVIGFEPIEENIKTLNEKLDSTYDSEALKERFLIVQIGLGEKNGKAQFYVTKDRGQASFLKPVDFEISEIVETKTVKLDTFMGLFNPHRFSRIDYIKTDCQGFDLEFLKGAKLTLAKTAVVTCEAESKAYFGSTNSREAMEDFLNDLDFKCINPRGTKSKIASYLAKPFSRLRFYQKFVSKRQSTPVNDTKAIVVLDPTFVNNKFEPLVASGKISALQFN